MVQKINFYHLHWFRKQDSLNSKKVNFFVGFIPFIVPRSFKHLLKFSNGGELDDVFEYYDISMRSITQNTVGFIYGVNRSEYNFGYDLIYQYKNPPEFFPANLVAFAETGNGDRVCFDYRLNPKTDNPPVVYWNHDADIGQDVSFVANNFEEFIQMLKEPEDDYQDGDEDEKGFS